MRWIKRITRSTCSRSSGCRLPRPRRSIQKSSSCFGAIALAVAEEEQLPVRSSEPLNPYNLKS